MRLTAAQRSVLSLLERDGRLTPSLALTAVSTWKALAKRKLILVDTTFDSIAKPKSNAWASITDLGRAALAQSVEKK